MEKKNKSFEELEVDMYRDVLYNDNMEQLYNFIRQYLEDLPGHENQLKLTVYMKIMGDRRFSPDERELAADKHRDLIGEMYG